MNNVTTQYCCSCQESLSNLRDNSELTPCRCVMCAECLRKAHMERGNSALICPGCWAQVEGISPHETAATVNSDGNDDAEEFTPYEKEDFEETAEQQQQQQQESTKTKKPSSTTRKRKRYAPPLCKHEGCTKRVESHGLCVLHGAQRSIKYCSHEGCPTISQKMRVCVKHTAKKTVHLCNVKGCTNSVEECSILTSRGKCSRCDRRSRKLKCSVEGCSNQAQSEGVCCKHGRKASRKNCSHEGCPNMAVNNGVCVRHGAKVKTYSCDTEGCSTKIWRRGKCKGHSPKCDTEGCSNVTWSGGKCKLHSPLWRERTKNQKNKNVKCSVGGCTEISSGRRGICTTHFRVMKCKRNFCSNIAVRGGRCMEHDQEYSSLVQKGISSQDERTSINGQNNHVAVYPGVSPHQARIDSFSMGAASAPYGGLTHTLHYPGKVPPVANGGFVSKQGRLPVPIMRHATPYWHHPMAMPMRADMMPMMPVTNHPAFYPRHPMTIGGPYSMMTAKNREKVCQPVMDEKIHGSSVVGAKGASDDGMSNTAEQDEESYYGSSEMGEDDDSSVNSSESDEVSVIHNWDIDEDDSSVYDRDSDDESSLGSSVNDGDSDDNSSDPAVRHGAKNNTKCPHDGCTWLACQVRTDSGGIAKNGEVCQLHGTWRDSLA